MAQKGPLSVTRIFLLFFSVTAIIPVLLLGSFLATRFHQDIDVKIEHLLDTGSQFSQSAIQNELSKLELTANQASRLAINEKLRHYMSTGEGTPLEDSLTQLANSQNVDLVALLDTQGTIIASTDSKIGPVHPISFSQLIRDGLNGKVTSALEELRFNENNTPHIYYLASCPVFYEEGSSKIMGVLLIGENMNENFSLKQHAASVASLYFRIYETDQDDRPFLSNFKSKQFPKPNFDSARSFEEDIQGETFQSIVTPLQNSLGDRIGHIVISTSKRTEHDIQSRVLAYSVMALLFGILCLSLIAWWFKRTIVNPLDDLAKASRRVAQGDLSTRLNAEFAQREIQEAILQFNQMLSELEKNEKLRQNFVSSLTHDLRTPLLAERRVLELFEDYKDDLPPKLGSLTKGLITSNGHLLEMVNQMLEMYKYEAGKTPTHFQPIVLEDIVDNSLNKLRPLAGNKNIELKKDIAPNLPKLMADPHQLERVFTNLVGNAIENIPAGSQIQIHAQLEADQNSVQIILEDNGPGIPSDLLPLLFERYANIHGTQKKIGSGLGLAICKMIAEAHQGTIRAENFSPPDTGARFILNLPLKHTPKGADTPDKGRHDHGIESPQHENT
jgi:signal transduction histidine kinase